MLIKCSTFRAAQPLADRKGIVYACKVEQPKDGYQEIVDAVEDLVCGLRGTLILTGDQLGGARGPYENIHIGTSYGGGPKVCNC